MNGVDVVRGSPASGIDPLEPGKRVEMSFSFAQETTKQILTLSTAVVAFTVTFSKDFVAGAPYDARAYITMPGRTSPRVGSCSCYQYSLV
jgi:hypothetical protein